jgi:hypothetical protein
MPPPSTFNGDQQNRRPKRTSSNDLHAGNAGGDKYWQHRIYGANADISRYKSGGYSPKGV